jgi:propanol-preferring alcohol dehydrogenase
MRCQQLDQPHQPLRLVERATPQPARGQVLLRVTACGVCRTDLHIVDGELPALGHPVVPGHEIVGEVVATGSGVAGIETGMRMGVPWLGATCGHCRYCRTGNENLCDDAHFTGYHIDGGYADHALADARYCFPIPPNYTDAQAAPLLCAGLIGHRAYAMAGDAKVLGLYGFGAAAHILAQIAVAQGRTVYAYTRRGDVAAQTLARELGAAWAGASDEAAPTALDAAIIFAPAGALVPRALAATRKGGTVVCAGIHMTDIPSFPYSLLWGERRVVSVANLTRRDGEAFLAAAAHIPIKSTVHFYPLESANQALQDLREGRFAGAAVLLPSREPDNPNYNPESSHARQRTTAKVRR